ncbi:hypothetical protein GTV15_22500 [Streptomyces sp. SID7803]|nr:hypothetical protein [Streptomyces sp. SID7803]
MPDELRAVLETHATDEVARLMAPLPWMRAVETTTGSGLQRCLHAMLRPPGADDIEGCDDPWS